MWTDKAKELIARTRGQVGLLVKNLKTGEVLFSYNTGMVFPSCSVIKVPILLTLMDEAADGRIDLGQPEPVSPDACVEGSGLVRHLSEGLPLTCRDHALLMIALSDNTSTNKLISLLGMQKINEKIRELGMKDTVLARKMMDFEAKAQGKDNFTSCDDMLILFTRLYDNPDRYGDAIAILKQQQLNSMLAASLDTDAFEFAHKTGGLPYTHHDIGIMYLKDPIFVSFMTKELKEEKDGLSLAHDIGLLIYEAFR